MSKTTSARKHRFRSERLAERVWAYVREHASSLDSERHCRVVSEMVVAEVYQYDQDVRRLKTVEKNLRSQKYACECKCSELRRQLKEAVEWNGNDGR